MRRPLLAFALACALGSANAVAAGEPVDPRALAPLLRAQDFAALESRLGELDATRARTREGWLALPRSLFALGVATADDPALGANLDAWRRASPQSWSVEMVSGWRQLLLGHAPRAADRSLDGVAIPDQRDPERRATARTAFERARSLAPRSPEPGAALLGIAVSERAPLADRQQLFEQACAFDPACESARVVMLTGLEPQLGGSTDALLAFARESASEHPGDPNLGLLVAFAHRKVAIASGDPEQYFRDVRTFEEVERAYAAHFAAYPTALNHTNEFARVACWADRRDTARRAFEKIGDAFSANAWKDDFREFVSRRRWALGTSPAENLARIAP